jgi:hypothetical protein
MGLRGNTQIIHSETTFGFRYKDLMSIKAPSKVSRKVSIASPSPGEQTLRVLPAESFYVHSGTNAGDPLTQARDIELSDTYRVAPEATPAALSITYENAILHVGRGSAIGEMGARLHLDCIATLMSPDGSTVEAIVIVETNAESFIQEVYISPFVPLQHKQDYTVIALDSENMRERLIGIFFASFARNTLITMSTGMQKPIQDLQIGDHVLTRDSGARKIKWIGSQTARAAGDFAPIIIKKGALNNDNDLIMSPNHRVLIYQRKNRLDAKRAEVMVTAKALVNGTSVVQSNGGFVEYYQLLFDKHEIVYAEGIATESMFLDKQVKKSLPEDIQAELSKNPELHSAPTAFQLPDDANEASRAVEYLRASSQS